MSSTSKCPYCGGTVSSQDKHCPHCDAVNQNYVEDTPRQIFQPKTIDELKEYCAERGMPLLRMRFFIGEDFKEPKAFGIYRDGDRYVVYKNKGNGQRAIRYQGPDEAYAVNELFMKLLSECHNRGIYPDGKPPETQRSAAEINSSKKVLIVPIILAAISILAVLTGLVFACVSCIKSCESHRNDGYYKFDNTSTTWYHYGDSWYYSDTDSSDWHTGYPVVGGEYTDYYLGDDYESDWGVTDFKDSDTYDDLRSSSDDSGSDSSYDSWDIGGTDWDIDW